VLRTAPGPRPSSVRVDYEVRRDDRVPLPRRVVCRFAGEGLSLSKADIVELSTEREVLSGAALYLLKRYYIDTPEGVAGDPGAEPGGDGLAEIPPAAADLAQALLVSLPRTAIYALLAAAYALVFGLVSRINLAFGEIAALGGAAATAGASLAVAAGIASPLAGLAAGLVLAAFAAGMHGAVGGWLAVGAVPPRHRQASLIATVGLSLALMEGLRLAGSTVTVWLPPVWSGAVPLAKAGTFVVAVTPMTLLVAGLGFLAAGALLALIARSAYGRAWRAVSDDPLAAALMGVDVRRLLLLTLALSGALAGLAGGLVVAQYGAFGFAGGFVFGLKALIAAVLGGIGSVPGALLGGVLVALFETLWSWLMPIEGRDAALYAVLVAVLIWRPGGLLGLPEARPRQV
jgi:branched-chain amino acid transport system permease protein